jgi:hypothetical protein
MGLCYTATSGAVKHGNVLEYRYYPQEAEYHYYDDEHHCDGKQVAVTHCATSLETHPAPEKVPLRQSLFRRVGRASTRSRESIE